MEILHVTDLHGCEVKYNKLIDFVKKSKIDAVINSGDILPKNGTITQLVTIQKDFIDNFYKTEILDFFEKEKIHYLSFLGNDDLKIHEIQYKNIHNDYKYCHEITQKSNLYINNYNFIGYNYVPDYPFRLKDWVRQDVRSRFEHYQLGTAMFSNSQHKLGYRIIGDWQNFLTQTRTIKDELDCCLDKYWKMNENTIFVCHAPPANINIDKIEPLKGVGSLSVTDFILDHQPKISLHGHIHESYTMSGTYFGKINNTLCFNPGQKAKTLPYVIISLEPINHKYGEI